MDLVARWTDLVGAETRGLGEELVGRYAEPHRRYHTLAHLEAVLDLVDEFAGEADDPDLVRLAAWFHDAVYDPQRDDNEERSAVLAERMLADTSLEPARAQEVARGGGGNPPPPPTGGGGGGGPTATSPDWRGGGG